MATNLRITFRAKLDSFAGGKGYKVPRLTSSHVVTGDDMLAVMFSQSLADDDLTRTRLRKYAGLDLPGVVWADSPGPWTIAPDGSGFMATVTYEGELVRS